MGENI
jgi:hypothetical protein